MNTLVKEELKKCILCLERCDDDFVLVDGELKRKCLFILVYPDEILDNETICNSCKRSLEMCYHFKLSSISTEESIKSLCDSSGAKINLMDVYRAKNGGQNSISEDHFVCRLCLKLTDYGWCVILSDNDKSLLANYFPELNINITGDSQICASCHTRLENYYHFVQNYSLAKQKIHKSEETSTVCSIQNQAEINFTQECSLKTEAKYEDYIYSYSWKGCSPEVEVKSGGANLDVKTVKDYHEHEYITENNFKQVSKEESKNQNEDIKSEDVDIKSEEDFDWDQADQSTLFQSTDSKSMAYHCQSCDYETTNNKHLADHIVVQHTTQKVTEEAEIIYECQVCQYKTEQMTCLKSHITSTHASQKVYECEKCEYKTKHGKCFKRHKARSETDQHQCELCECEDYLRQHTVVHEHEMQNKMYRRENCTHAAKNKGSLKRHTAVHEDEADVAKYQCDLCDYKTKHKHVLKNHRAVHQGKAEAATLTKPKTDFKSNQHQDESNLTMLQCEVCEFKTKRKRAFEDHLKGHLKGGICGEDGFKKKHKSSLKKRRVVDKGESDKLCQ